MLYLVQFFCTALFYGSAILFVQCGVHRLRAKLELNSRRRKRKRPTSESKKKTYINQAMAVSISAMILFVMTMPYHAAILVRLFLGKVILPDVFVIISYYLSICHVIICPVIYGCHLLDVGSVYYDLICHTCRCRSCKCSCSCCKRHITEDNMVELRTLSLRRQASGSMLRLRATLDGREIRGVPRIVVTDHDHRGRRVDADWSIRRDGSPDWSIHEDNDIWCSTGTCDVNQEVDCNHGNGCYDVSNHGNPCYDLSGDTLASGHFLELPNPEWN